MLVKTVSFTLFDGSVDWLVMWRRARNKWEVHIVSQGCESFEDQFVSIYVAPVPSLERSIELIGNVDKPNLQL